METAGPFRGENMKEETPSIVLARTLDRLRLCADGRQSRICLTSRESYEVCAYIWWLTDEIAKAKQENSNEDADRDRDDG